MGRPDSYQTDEFGIPGSGAGTSTQPFGYTGEMRDAETGLLNLRARMYDAETGRMMQRDPVTGHKRQPATLNRYAYVLNNPVKYVDPSGLQEEDGGDTSDSPVGAESSGETLAYTVDTSTVDVNIGPDDLPLEPLDPIPSIELVPNGDSKSGPGDGFERINIGGPGNPIEIDPN